MIILILLVTLIFLIYITGNLYSYYIRNKIKNIKTKKPISGPGFFSLFKLVLFGMGNKTRNDMFIERHKNFGDVYSIFLGIRNRIILNNHLDAKKYLKSYVASEKLPIDFNDKMRKFFGISQVLSANGSAWKRQRKILDPAFYRLEKFYKYFLQKSRITVGKLAKDTVINGHIDDVINYTQKFTLDVLGLSVFDHEFNSIDGKFSKSLEAYDILMDRLFDLKYILFPFLSNVKFLSYHREMENAINEMNKLVFGLIEKSRKKLKSGKAPTSMLDSMVINSKLLKDEGDEDYDDEENSISLKEIRNNTIIFFLAGHDTTSSSLSFGMLRLAKHQNIQKKIREELTRVIKDKKNIKFNELSKLDYTMAFIKEVMRYHPPVRQIPGRTLTKSLKIGGYKIPKGEIVAVNTISIHFDKRVYGDPLNFRPERWLDKSNKIPSSAWIPFSSGSRVCMGNTFSLLEQKVFYAELLLNYSVRLENPKYVIKEDPKAPVISKPAKTPLIFDPLVV